MITRLHLEDWRIIGHYLGVLILLVAIAMIPPFIMSLCLSEFSTAVDFLLSIGITGIVGSVLLFSKVELATLDWRQSLVITGLCWVVLSVFGALPLWMSGHYDGYLDAFFESVSAFTTTGGVVRRGLFEVLSGGFNLGFSTLQGGQVLFAMGSGALFVIILSMTICGSSSSASGGIKALRIGIIARSVVQAIREALAPDRARPRTFYFQKGRHRLTPELVSSAMIIFLLYMVTYAVGAIAGIAYGYEALPAIFDSVSAASNTGLSLGVAAPGMPNGLEIIYIFEMWLGRLEFIAILAMVVEMLAFLVPRRRSKWVRRKK